MKVYVCFLTYDCEGQFSYPYRNRKHPWVGFTDEEDAKKWVKDKMAIFKEKLKQHNYGDNFEAGYETVEIIE